MFSSGARVYTVCPVVLAGGLSRRMGSDKALLKLPGGQSMLERACDLVAQLPALPGMRMLPALVSGSRPGGIPDRYEDVGPLGGLQAITDHLRERDGDGNGYGECDVLLVVPVDMPLLQARHLQVLCRAGAEGDTAVCFGTHFLPCWLPLNPACQRYLQAAVAGEAARSVRGLLDHLDCRQLAVPPGDWHMNANRPGDYEALTERLAFQVLE